MLLNVKVNFLKGAAAPLAAAALALAVIGPARAFADEGDSAELEAHRLVHILGYTAGDYAGAVEGGKIKSESEYEEQLALLADANKIAAKLESAGEAKGADITKGVAEVAALVRDKRPEADVEAAVSAVRARVSTAFKLSDAPSSPPDLARGKAIFAESCATCHGATGKADTARAASLNPHPANFFDEKVSDPLSPGRVEGTVRFGINGTAMAPMGLSDADRWAVAFYVMGLRYEGAELAEPPAYTVAELAVRSDAELASELAASGVPERSRAGMIASLRRRAPFESREGKPLASARVGIDRARAALRRHDRAAAKAALFDAYLDGVEPQEGALKAVDSGLVTDIEKAFVLANAGLQHGASDAEVDASLATLLAHVGRAEIALAPGSKPSFVGTAISSAGILLREGVEAALLVAALLGVATQAGLAARKRYVHIGWVSALALGVVTWFFATRLVAISGASREKIEGVTALVATCVLFYVSYSLLAKQEVARWLRFLRAQVTPRRAALSLFGVAFVAAYREAFETILFYQALLASNADKVAALVGAASGAVVLAAVVWTYSRAGRFAPPQVFFRVSSVLLYALAVVFAGQGVAALQLTGTLPAHPLPVPTIDVIGLHATVETCAAQLLLIGLAVAGRIMQTKATTTSPPSAAPKAA
jgi:high-affinity iron transporter